MVMMMEVRLHRNEDSLTKYTANQIQPDNISHLNWDVTCIYHFLAA
jgi:hypothetical protein